MMKLIRLLVFLVALSTALALAGTESYAASYTASWVGNTFATGTNYVGNCARSMWVAPDGVVYTASMWDENGRAIGVYQGGAVVGGMGNNKDPQGSAIGGDSTSVYVALQSPSSGSVGRYNRSSGNRDLVIPVTSGAGDVITGIAVSHGELYVSDSPGNRVRVFTTAGEFVREWKLPHPGAIAVESAGDYVWVAQMNSGVLYRFRSTGSADKTIQLPKGSSSSALAIDAKGQLWVGDKGPDMNIKIYGGLAARPALVGTYGVAGGYLAGPANVRGEVGSQRFTRVAGIGFDSGGNVYVLNNPWGGSWDLGRNGGTDIHCYDGAGTLAWTLQALNFEGCAAPDPGTDGGDLYSGNILYSGTGGAAYKANTIDPFRYPSDPRIDMTSKGRGEHFGHVASIRGRRILVANGQNPDVLYTYYFNPATDGYVAIPGRVFGLPARIRGGFHLDSSGDIWTAKDGSKSIQRYPFTGFAGNGAPTWGGTSSTPVPTSIAPLNRLEYLPASDTMVLAGGHTNWTLGGTKAEVYKGWSRGNRKPNAVIALNRGVAKSISAAGAYLFVGYHALPNIDVFDLASGALVTTMVGDDAVAVGNDVDSMYGVKAYLKANGEYMVTKDDYNTNKVVVYTFFP